MSYLDRLKGLDEQYSSMEATAKTERIDLRGFCSSPIEQKRSIPAEAEPAGEDTPSGVSWRWWLHFAARDPLTVAFSPEATHGEVLDFYPDALAAEPIKAGGQEPGAIMVGDGLRSCNDCGNLRGAVCIVAKPGGLVSAIVGYRPVSGMLQRCAGFIRRMPMALTTEGDDRQ